MADQEPGVDQRVDEPAAAPQIVPGVSGPTDAGPPQKPWYERRLDEVTASYRNTERERNAALERAQIAEQALELAKKGGVVVPQVGSPEFDQAVQRTAMGQADVMAFNARANRIAAEGLEKFPDFDSSISTWKRLGELTRPIIEAADETGHAAEIIYELGKDPAAAERILKLPPIQQIAAVVKYANKYNVAPVVGERRTGLSTAPEPIKTVVGGSGAVPEPTLFDTEKLTTKQWIEKREAELEAKRSKRRA